MFGRGGGQKEWNTINPIRSQSVEQQKSPSVGDIMRELADALKHINRTNFPIFLDPKTASFLDVAVHAKIRQYLEETTIEHYLTYARFMESHPMPIDFRNLSPERFLRHCDYRIQVENASGHALAHERKAVTMFLRAYGIFDETWTKICRTPPVVVTNDVEVVYPKDVHRFFMWEAYSKLRNYKKRVYENKLFQHIAFIGFMFGMRPPSEIVNLDLKDVKINDDGTGYIRIHEKKKHGRIRRIYPFNSSVLSSMAYKSPRNYLENWRWKVENEHSENAFFLQPNGRRITEKYLRSHLSSSGKDIAGMEFHPYVMRHTFATYLYSYTKDIEFVKNMLGHTKTANTNKYVHIAQCLEKQLNGNLFNMALKPHDFKNVGAKPNKPTLGQRPKRPQLKAISPVERSGLSRVRTGDLRRVKATS